MEINGVYPPITTPFDEQENINFSALEKNIAKWNETGLAGYVVFGSNGEYAFLSEQEKLDIVKACVANAAKDKKVIVGSGCESTRDTIDLTNKCAKLGADAALLITPNYYKGSMNKKALKEHFIRVADAAELPILLYNVPKFTNINMDSGLVEELARHPNIVGIKDSSANITQLAQIISQAPADFNVLVGTAGVLYPGLAFGAKGGIMALATCCPKECLEIYTLFNEGKYEEAKKLQMRMIPVNNAVTATYGIAGLKFVMDTLGLIGGPTRRPLLPLSEEEKAKLKEILVKANLL
ncbi:MAG: 4-hydroxy-2-oxoglutarate aldolase [Clostridia bacterium]|jgi:4-hydroxy-2-oxoglutarate aldolase|nr:4-hydroxy-2-oxoglutarate aldolase [Clostridia bacterium]MDN5322165.1 4-hydroxy-2-oxoglutarate aldolase [Clostridia bacterium]